MVLPTTFTKRRRQQYYIRLLITIVILNLNFETSKSFTLSPSILRIILDFGTIHDDDYHEHAITTDILKKFESIGVDDFIFPEEFITTSPRIMTSESNNLSLNGLSHSPMIADFLPSTNSNVFVGSSKNTRSVQQEQNQLSMLYYAGENGEVSTSKFIKVFEIINAPCDKVNKFDEHKRWEDIRSDDTITIVCGDASFVNYVINQILPPGLLCVWKPKDAFPKDIEVWKLRSLGVCGLLLDANLLPLENKGEEESNNDESTSSSNKERVKYSFDIGLLSHHFRRMRRPCSAMDYPPTIYMIGEDEIS